MPIPILNLKPNGTWKLEATYLTSRIGGTRYHFSLTENSLACSLPCTKMQIQCRDVVFQDILQLRILTKTEMLSCYDSPRLAKTPSVSKTLDIFGNCR